MFTKLAKILSPSLRKKEGFTLIELLIVVAIIAILAAIAIPQFSAYRKRGYNAAAVSDMRNTRTSQEGMFADFQDYGITQLATSTAGGFTGAGTLTTAGTAFFLCGNSSATTCQRIDPSPGVSLLTSAFLASGKNARYSGASKHNNGDVIYGVDSAFTAIYRKAGVEATALAAGDLTTPTDATTNNFTAPTWTQIQ